MIRLQEIQTPHIRKPKETYRYISLTADWLLGDLIMDHFPYVSLLWHLRYDDVFMW